MCTGITRGNARYHYHEIGARFGAAPELIADFLALTGDAVDNIPGVPGIGKKTAAELFACFGSLDELYANLGRVPRLKLRGAAAVAAKLLAAQGRRLPRAALDRHRVRRAARRCTRMTCGRDRPTARGLEAFFDAHGFGSILRQQARRIVSGHVHATVYGRRCMDVLILGLAMFLGVHSIAIVAPGLRNARGRPIRRGRLEGCLSRSCRSSASC